MSLKGLIHPINDITTSFDPVPGLQNGRSYPEHFRSIQNDLYPDLKPFSARLEAEALFSLALATAHRQKSWQVVDTKDHRIHVVATTPLLRFRDDITIEVRDSAGGAALHMRSRSRLGRNDFGANAKRIRAFFAEIAKALK